MVVKTKHESRSSEIFYLSNSGVKQHSERGQRFHFDTSEVRQSSERSQWFHFSVTYVKQIVFLWLVLHSSSERNMIS